MKLKTKFQDEDFDLGEVVNAGFIHNVRGGITIIATARKGGRHMFPCDSLKKLNDLFEDCEKSRIKINKKQKAVIKAFLEANGLEKDETLGVGFISYSGRPYMSIYFGHHSYEIDLIGLPKNLDGMKCTVAELGLEIGDE